MTIRATVIAATFLAAVLSSSASAQTINGCVKGSSHYELKTDGEPS